MTQIFNSDKFKKKMDKLSLLKSNVTPKMYKDFLDNTPKDTGNAKRNTKLVNYIITAKYMYAKVLNDGRRMTNKGMKGSTQSPDGMVKPTVARIPKWIKDYIRSI